MQKSHRRNEDDPSAVTPLGFAPAAHFLDALNDLHGQNRSIGVLE
jgi:hypothetical protein